MPITKKQFEKGNFEVKLDNGSYILDFLKENKNKAWKIDEISKGVNKTNNTIRYHLRKLVKKKLVKRKIPYYMFAK